MRRRGCVVLGMVCFIAAAMAVSAGEAEAPKAEKGEKAAKAKSGKKGEKGEKGAKEEGGWIQLFNGKDLKGWKAEGNAEWKVEDGNLVGRQGQPGNKPGDLFTERSFKDFELICTYKCIWPCNTGVWFRYKDAKTAYQADILEYVKPEAYSGTLYSPNLPKGQVFLAANLDKTIEKKDDWNTMRIIAHGDHLVVYLNDKKTAEATDSRIPEGKIGFQVHPGKEFEKMAIMVKEIKLRPLKPAKGAENAESK